MGSRSMRCVTLAILATMMAVPPGSAPALASDYYAHKGTFVMGGGFNNPVGETTPYLNSSGSIIFGGGRNINPRLAFQVEYTHNWLTIDPAVIDRAQSDSTQFSGTRASLWSITLNAVFRFKGRTDMVPWVTAGAGYYKRNLQFTEDTYVYIPPVWDPWWGWVDGGWVPGESVVGQRSTTAIGYNAGFGLDFPIEGSTLLFIEARYHYAPMDGVNMQIVPIMAGIRW